MMRELWRLTKAECDQALRSPSLREALRKDLQKYEKTLKRVFSEGISKSIAQNAPCFTRPYMLYWIFNSDFYGKFYTGLRPRWLSLHPCMQHASINHELHLQKEFLRTPRSQLRRLARDPKRWFEWDVRMNRVNGLEYMRALLERATR